MAKNTKKTFAELRREILADESPEGELGAKPPEKLAGKSVEKSPEKTLEKWNKNHSFFDSPTFWLAGAALVLLVAIALRFYDLSLKPFHHDEGVNSFFLITLFRTGVYHYDPQNYHGPTLYFFALVSSHLFGLNDFAVRFVPAIFGVLCVVGILYLRPFLGRVGALTAAMLIALSPGEIFISRYFIHELLFVFFTFGVLLGVLRFMSRRRPGSVAVGAMAILLLSCLLPGTLNFASLVGGENVEIRNVALVGFFVLEAGIVFLLVRSLLAWENGRPIYLLLAAASAALTFATKETAFISFGTILLAVASVSVWLKIWRSGQAASWREPVELSFKTFRLAIGDATNAVLLGALCAIIFGYVGALFYSSFFTFPEGIYGAFEAYAFWTKTGSKDHTQNGSLAYLKWLWAMEAPLLFLGAVGALIAFLKANHRFAMFAALWAWGLLAAYSIIPYKTPWLAVNFILPLGIIAGYGINELAVSRSNWLRGTAAFLAAIAFGVAIYQSVNLNFDKYDDDSRPYVYAHTKREIFGLINNVKRIAEISGKSKDASILIVSPDYWPLPWYFREYPNAAFYGQIYPSETSEIIVGSVAQAAELDAEYSAHYDFIGTYTLRPGVDLMLYVRKDLTDRATAE